MPKAFTHLCNKVNISLYNDTLTVYPKPSPTQTTPAIMDFETYIMKAFYGMNCNSIKVNKLFIHNKNELGIARFIHREDTDHYLYHQDGFNRDSDHYHAQFKNIINEAKLEEILTILEKYSIILHIPLNTAH